MKTNETKKLTIAEVKKQCREYGYSCKWNADTKEFIVNGYFTDCGQDAIDTAKHMAEFRDGKNYSFNTSLQIAINKQQTKLDVIKYAKFIV